ncbi:hypothetical protein OC861_005983 [Tilletia horrida]|nr:hypothetical protein OC861_005983 [Tilletia horrida]
MVHRSVDAFVLNQDRTRVDVYLWDHAAFAFRASPSSSITAPSGQTIVNVVPADFDYDGRLDVLLMTQSSSSLSYSKTSDELRLGLYLGQDEGVFASQPVSIDSSTLAQPLMLDASGDMRTDFLAHPYPSSPSPYAKSAPLQVWRNNFTAPSKFYPGSQGFVKQDAAFFDKNGRPTTSSCQLAHPHSSAYIDLNGDCLADLSYEVWIANNNAASSSPSSAAAGYTLSHTGDLPPGSGALSFADMDRDGTIDVVFPSCDPKGGNKAECHINIAYNRQIPLCMPEKDGFLGGLGHGGGQRVIDIGDGKAAQSPSAAASAGGRKCRQPGELCTADPSFTFNFSTDSSNQDLLRIPVSNLLRAHLTDSSAKPQIVITDPASNPATPIPMHLGDFNKDGYPDILLLTTGAGLQTSSSSKKEGSSSDGRVWLIQNVRDFQQGGPAFDGSKRTLAVVEDGAEVLREIRDAKGASWIDVDEDGTLDILLQRTGSEGNGQRVTFIQNNYFHDAFFLKALTLNGACQGLCEVSSPGGKSNKFKPWGHNYGGASYKFTVLDTNGLRKAQQVGQLPQTGYRSLLTPYSYFGLGRTNNYVETLFVGSTRRRGSAAAGAGAGQGSDSANDNPHYLVMEGVVPNSEVLISPWEERVERPPPSSDSGGKVGNPDVGPWMPAPGASTSTWRRELFLQPGDWIPWVTVVLVTVVLMLGIVVLVLHFQEKREDERERKRAVHEINFAAL